MYVTRHIPEKGITPEENRTDLLYVGQKPDGSIDAQHVTEIQADNDELTRCLHITGRPTLPHRVMRFYGDDAKHIVGNWYWSLETWPSGLRQLLAKEPTRKGPTFPPNFLRRY